MAPSLPYVTRNERRATREAANGRIYERTVVTWDLVQAGELISEHRTRREALTALKQRQEAGQ